jgi:P27 family predicted phage terminase small subunit
VFDAEEVSVMRGRKPIPTHLKLVRGNPGKRAIRSEPQPQQPQQVLEPPSFLMPGAKAEWRRISGELTRLGLLTTLDVQVFAAYCQACARWQEAERMLAESGGALTVISARGNEMPSPVVRIADDAASDMLKYGSEFGLSPASRARLSGQPSPGAGKFHDLLGPTRDSS